MLFGYTQKLAKVSLLCVPICSTTKFCNDLGFEPFVPINISWAYKGAFP